MTENVVILGGGAQARHFDLDLADGPHSDCEIWGINMQHTKADWVPTWDRMFNLHKYELLKMYGYPTYRDAVWARDNPLVRFVTVDTWPDKRMRSEIFPAARLMDEHPRGRYHCNSLDWLILYALDQGFKNCYLHGWTLERDGPVEQMSAAKCAEYWAGYAEGKGMRVLPADDCAIFSIYHMVKSERLYGHDDCPAWEDKTKDGVPYRYDDF